ncbi:LysR family transcriptional regulator [Pendulispora albinea]|uniref:LysR family transcriptional regulator n=1 Tax=Pendulispora albinea TaxID=2741071 RepID=A0ABZ2LVM0_9BACT
MNRTMSIDDLRVVIAVANQGSFIAAAHRTHVPTSTVSRAVARFEEAVGVRLFQRTSRRVSLTHEGALLLERAAPLLEELGEVIGKLSDDSQVVAGRLRVTAPMVTGAGPIGAALMSFAEANPKVTVELSLSNAVVDLVESGIDLAFRGGPVEGADLIVQRIGSVPFAIGASRSFVQRELPRRKALDLGALESLPAIIAHPGFVWRFRREDGTVREVQPRARFCVNDPRVAVDAAARGLGLVRSPPDLLAAAGLVVLEPARDVGKPEGRDLFAVYPSRRLVPKRVTMAVEWVARALAGPESPRKRPARS